MGDGLEASEDLSEHTEVLVHVAFNSADFAASLQLFAQIHIYSRIEMSGFALKDWWGLPPTLTGLTLPQATATVKHALSFAHTLRVGGIGPLLEFMMIVNDPRLACG